MDQFIAETTSGGLPQTAAGVANDAEFDPTGSSHAPGPVSKMMALPAG